MQCKRIIGGCSWINPRAKILGAEALHASQSQHQCCIKLCLLLIAMTLNRLVMILSSHILRYLTKICYLRFCLSARLLPTPASWFQGDHSPRKPGKVREFQTGQGKVGEKWKKSGEVKSGVFFQVLNTPKLVFRPAPDPTGGAYELRRSPKPSSRLGRGTPHPLSPAVTAPTVK